MVQPKPASQHSHPRMLLWPALRVRPRLLASIVTGVCLYAVLALVTDLGLASAALLAWNVGALLFLVLAWHEMGGIDDAHAIQARALTQVEGRKTILTLVVLSACAVFVAVGTQLAQAKDMDEGLGRSLHLVLAGSTVLTSWFFTQTLFALHYAHDFYVERHHGKPDPLDFPGTKDPGYSDFFHFACIIGAAAQTADVSFCGRRLRAVGTVHCVLAFFFNTTVLALSINVVAGLLV